MSKRIDPVLLLLFGGLLLFTVILLFVVWRFNSDGQTFQVISGLVTGFAGAFFGRMKPSKDQPSEDGGASTVTITTPVSVDSEGKGN